MNKIIESKQKNITFIKCDHPFTIDRSKDWGEGNLRQFPEGGWLRVDNGKVSRGVQSNEENTAPVGWIKNENGTFDKENIYVIQELELGDHEIDTMDGRMKYEVKEKSYLVCNLENNKPNLRDAWIMKEKDLVNNYIV